MKTIRKLMLMAALCLCFGNYLKAQYIVGGKEIDTSFNHQMNFVFGNLDKSHVPFGLLTDYAMEFTNLPNYNGTNMADSTLLNGSILRDIYKTLITAQVTAAAYSAMPNPNITDSVWYSKRKVGQIAVCGLFYQYGYLDAGALDAGKITVTGGQYFDKFTGGVYQNPYLTANVLAFAPATETYMGQSFNILLTDDLWLSNSKTLVDHIEVDAGDGLGYRTLTPNTPMPVNYADTGLKVWNFKLYLTNSTVLQSHTRLQVNADVYGQNLPLDPADSLSTMAVRAVRTLAPAGGRLTPLGVTTGRPPGTPGFYYVTSSETYNGIPGTGSITVRKAPGHAQIQQPLIVVEGYDVGRYVTPEVYTGMSSIQQFVNSLHDDPTNTNLISLLDGTGAQYDIIYIDYYDGTDDIRRNALLVKEVIRWVNSVKQPLNGVTQQNVVLGQSMGGIVARYALKKMEDAGESHDVSLFISHDGPQQGANVPVGYQFFGNHAKNLYLQAGVGASTYNLIQFLTNGVNIIPGTLNLGSMPASEQMLINHIDNSDNLDNGIHNSWQTELTALGYPANCRNVAISNGSECGQTQTIQPGSTLFSVNGNLSTTFLGDMIGNLVFPVVGTVTGQPGFILGGLPGKNTISMTFQVNASNTNGGNLAYYGHISYTKKLLWLVNVTTIITDRTKNAPSSLYHDNFGGGVYSFKPIGSNSSGSNALGSYGISFVNPIDFCFVPTPSALDISGNPNNLSQTDYLASYSEGSPPVAPKATPFANFITAYNSNPNDNEQHITFEKRNGDWLWGELKGGTNIITASCSYLCNQSITGPTTFCTSGVYTVSGVPSSVGTVNWTYTGGITGPATGNPVTVTPTVGGNGTITASVASNCTPTPFVLPVLTIFTGQAFLSSATFNSPTNPTHALFATSLGDTSPASYNQTCSSVHTAITVPFGTTVAWALVSSSTAITRFPSRNNIMFSFTAAGEKATFSLTISNACGSQTWYYNFESVSTGCGLYPVPQVIGQPISFGTSLAASSSAAPDSTASLSNVESSFANTSTNVAPQPGYYPNPADGSITITTRANPNAAPSAGQFSYKIYDKKSKIWSQGESPTGADIAVNTAGLPSGEYFLHITVNGATIKKHLVIQH